MDSPYALRHKRNNIIDFKRMLNIKIYVPPEESEDERLVDGNEDDLERALNSIHSLSSSDEEEISEGDVKEINDEIDFRWRKKQVKEKRREFLGQMTSPPCEEWTPFQYFKFFFDKELIVRIAEEKPIRISKGW